MFHTVVQKGYMIISIILHVKKKVYNMDHNAFITQIYVVIVWDDYCYIINAWYESMWLNVVQQEKKWVSVLKYKYLFEKIRARHE